MTKAELTADRDELLAVLKDVKQWIDSWSPSFTEDDEWTETAADMRAVLVRDRSDK